MEGFRHDGKAVIRIYYSLDGSDFDRLQWNAFFKPPQYSVSTPSTERDLYLWRSDKQKHPISIPTLKQYSSTLDTFRSGVLLWGGDHEPGSGCKINRHFQHGFWHFANNEYRADLMLSDGRGLGLPITTRGNCPFDSVL